MKIEKKNYWLRKNNKVLHDITVRNKKYTATNTLDFDIIQNKLLTRNEGVTDVSVDIESILINFTCRMAYNIYVLYIILYTYK